MAAYVTEASLAGEIMMVEGTEFVVHDFALLPNHTHIVLHLPESNNLCFAKAIDLLHLRTGTNCRRLVRPKLPPRPSTGRWAGLLTKCTTTPN